MANFGRGKALKDALDKKRGAKTKTVQRVPPSEQVKNEGSLGITVIDPHGSEGYSVNLVANYIRLAKNDDCRGIYEYAVEFSPPVDQINSKFIYMQQHEETIGHSRVFDGSKLYVPFQLNKVFI